MLNADVDIVSKIKAEEAKPLPQEEKVTAQNNSCETAKAILTELSSKYDTLARQALAISADYSDDGWKENPAAGKDLDYPYNKMLSKRPSFYDKVDSLQRETENLGSVLSGADLSEVRENFNNGGNKFREAFNLKMQAFKYMNKDAYVYLSSMPEIDLFIPRANTENSQAAYGDATEKAKAGLSFFSSGINKMSSLKKTYSDNLAKKECR